MQDCALHAVARRGLEERGCRFFTPVGTPTAGSEADDDGKARLRMFPERRHQNLQGIIHGAVTLSLIDISLFTTMHNIGSGNAGPSVTVELSTQFVGGGKPDRPLDAVCEIVRETGSMVFVRGTVVQEDHAVASFSGIVKKIKPRAAA